MGCNNGLSWNAIWTCVCFYLPHVIFLLYKVGQSLFSPASKISLYDAVCYDQFGIKPFHLINHLSHLNRTSQKFSWVVRPHGAANNSNAVSHDLTAITATCNNLTGPSEDIIQMQAANYIMIMKILQNVPAFILGLFCGGWIDRVGQRLPMIVSCFGGALVALAFVGLHLSGGILIPGILIGITLNSFTGRNTLLTTAVQSYITDRCTGEERTRQLGFLLAMNFFGLFGGSLLMGVMADHSSFWAAFLVVTIFYTASLILVFFLESERPALGDCTTDSSDGPKVGPDPAVDEKSEKSSLIMPNLESKKAGVRGEFKLLATCFRLENFTDTFRTFLKKRPNNLRLYLNLTFLCIILQNMCKSGAIDVLLLLVMHAPLSWPASGYGYLLSFQYAVVGIQLVVVLPVLLNKLHLSDSLIVIICTLAKAFGFAWLAASDETWEVYTAHVFTSTFGMIISCLRSIASKMVDADEQGRCFSLISCAEVLSDLVGVVIFTNLYYVGLTYPSIGIGLPFLVMSALHILLFTISVWVYIGIRNLKLEENGLAENDDEKPLTEATDEEAVFKSPGAKEQVVDNNRPTMEFIVDGTDMPVLGKPPLPIKLLSQN